MIYIYSRVSTTKQVEEGFSLGMQIEKCRLWLKMNDKTDPIKELIEEGVSGGKPLRTREQGEILFDSLKDGDTVIAYRLDRLFRDASDALQVAKEFKEMNVDLVLMDLGGSVLNDMMGKLFFTMMAAFAELERSKIAERMAMGKAKKKENGFFAGGHAPYGWKLQKVSKKDNILVVDWSVQHIIDEMVRRQDDGQSLRKIQTAMEYQGHKFSPATIRTIIQRARLTADAKKKDLGL